MFILEIPVRPLRSRPWLPRNKPPDPAKSAGPWGGRLLHIFQLGTGNTGSLGILISSH